MIPPHSPSVLCLGGCHVDVKAVLDGPVRLHTSNPVRTARTPGGVACNVARWLVRLGTPARLASVVGDDAAGAELLDTLRSEGVDVSLVEVVPGDSTAAYTAIIDQGGGLVLGTADMGIYRLLDRSWAERVIAGPPAPVIVVDTNPGPEALGAITAGKRTSLLAADPVSAEKASRLAGHLGGIDVVFPDAAELAVLSGIDGVEAGVAVLRERGVDTVVATFGPVGALLSTSSSTVRRPVAASDRVVDVTGAGDALLAGYVHAIMAAEPDPLAWGLAAASLAVETEETVPRHVTEDLVRRRL